MAVSLSNEARNEANDAILANCNGGSLKIYNSNNDVLVSIALQNPAFDPSAGAGVANMAGLPLIGTAGVGGNNDTTATNYKIFKSDGVTVVFSDTSVAALGLATTTIVENDEVQIDTFSFTHP
jgi:hypothetical protein